ncbi:MAG: outer membrane protein assembly factor BamD [Gammaproteobacteria bacterium]|nr:outer membrane protein assembly factor BamD [Gammaproteobacteria bacterium]MBU1413994.1 outer membrane protein assembly factor BamD [Gammaproteobacteria bacterium]
MIRTLSISLLLVTLSLFLSGCGESRAWSRAKETNSVESYVSFLQEYPASEYATDARERIRDIKWKNASSSMDTETVKTYLQEYPDASNLAEAKSMLEQCQQLDEIRKLPEHFAAFLSGNGDAQLKSVNGLNYDATVNLPRAGMYVSNLPSNKRKWIVLEDPSTKVSATFYYECGDGMFGDFVIAKATSVLPDDGSTLVFKNGHRYAYANGKWDRQ